MTKQEKMSVNLKEELYDYSNKCKKNCAAYHDGFDKGYQLGRADKYSEIASEYMLLTMDQIEQIRADVIEELKQSIHEIHKCQFYCMEEYCKYEEPTSHDCVECLYIAIQSFLEQLKEHK